jgi:5-methyltetrahydrofolate--homocysteine methyltransferase
MGETARDLRAALAARVLVGDGALGTQLQAAGLVGGQCAEEWNVANPDTVARVTSAYASAGADIVSTNTFGGSPARLAAHGLADRCEELNEAGARIAREAVGDGCFVVGSVGPTGLILEPYGDASVGEVTSGFCRQVSALATGGIHGILVETMISLEEAVAAVEAAREAAPHLPRFCTMAFQAEGRTSFGVTIERMVAALEGAGVDGLGLNCGTGTREAIPLVEEICRRASVAVVAQPNAGLPRLVGGQAVFDETPEEMAGGALRFVAAGARWVGGCCGSTPDHIAAVVGAVRGS